jgi:hypothetical protein
MTSIQPPVGSLATQALPVIDTKALAEVANKVNLGSVRFTRLGARLLGDPISLGSLLTLNFSFRVPWYRQEKRPGFDALFEFSCSIEDGGQSSPDRRRILEFEASLLLEYLTPENLGQEWNGKIDLFAQINAVSNAWPYIRSELQSTGCKLGLPSIVLPVFRPGRMGSSVLELKMGR